MLTGGGDAIRFGLSCKNHVPLMPGWVRDIAENTDGKNVRGATALRSSCQRRRLVEEGIHRNHLTYGEVSDTYAATASASLRLFNGWVKGQPSLRACVPVEKNKKYGL